MRIWAWVALLAMSVPNWAAERHMNDADYWRTTNLTLSYVKNFISNQVCYSSREYLFSCVEAINSAGAFMNSPLQIVATDRVEAPELILKQTPDLTVVDGVQLNRISGHSPWQRAQTEKAAREHLLRATNAHFTDARQANSKIDFEALLKIAMQALPPHVPTQMMLAAAIVAQMRVFDAHADLLPASREEAYLSGDAQPFFGIGVSLRELPSGVRIDEVFPNSPAQKAGLKRGDVITMVTSRPHSTSVKTGGKELPAVTDLIAGPRGIDVGLTVDRDGKVIQFEIPRERVQVSYVNSALIKYGNSSFGYIRIRTFMSAGICTKVREKLNEMERQHVRGLVLDLRHNPGGLLKEAVCVSGLLLGRQRVVGVKAIHVTLPGHAQDFAADANNPIQWRQGDHARPSLVPTVVLVDGGSASAAEIVSGALQAHDRAWLVGERTYGKGTVQTSFQMDDNDSLVLTETTGRFYLPSGLTNQQVGIEPDFKVPFEAHATAVESFTPREVDDFPNGLPPLNPPQKGNRPKEVAKIKSCIASQRQQEKIVSAMKRSEGSADYQKAYALAVLECSPVQEAAR